MNIHIVTLAACLFLLVASNTHANASSFCDEHVYSLTDTAKVISVVTRLKVVWISRFQYLHAPVAGRNKYGYPVPDAVKIARARIRRINDTEEIGRHPIRGGFPS